VANPPSSFPGRSDQKNLLFLDPSSDNLLGRSPFPVSLVPSPLFSQPFQCFLVFWPFPKSFFFFFFFFYSTPPNISGLHPLAKNRRHSLPRVSQAHGMQLPCFFLPGLLKALQRSPHGASLLSLVLCRQSPLVRVFPCTPYEIPPL